MTDLAVRGSLEEKVGAPSPRSSRDLRRSLVLTSTCPRAQALDLIDLEQRPRELRGESGGEVHDQHRLRLAELCLKELGRRSQVRASRGRMRSARYGDGAWAKRSSRRYGGAEAMETPRRGRLERLYHRGRSNNVSHASMCV